MKNQIKSILLLGTLSAILIAMGGLLAPGYLYLFGAMAVLMNLGAYYFSDRIVLAMHHAQEVSPAQAPALFRMVEELSRRAGIPTPRVFILPEEQPNAFATGRNPEHGVVAVTEGILRLLGERELRGVIAHELAHIKNRDILISSLAAAIASLITYLAHALSFMSLFGGHDSDEERGGSALGGLALAIVAPIAATLVQLGISRSREYLADQTGARISGDPEALAMALDKLQRGAEALPADQQPATASLFIVNPLSGSSMLSLFATHPPMGERIERLLEMARAQGGAPPARRRVLAW